MGGFRVGKKDSIIRISFRESLFIKIIRIMFCEISVTFKDYPINKEKDGADMRILVVEDDRLLNNTLCYNLIAVGYIVDSAMTKAAALEFSKK